VIVGVGVRNGEPRVGGHDRVLMLAKQILHACQGLGQRCHLTAEHARDGLGGISHAFAGDADRMPCGVISVGIKLPSAWHSVAAVGEATPGPTDKTRQYGLGRLVGALRQARCRRRIQQHLEQMVVALVFHHLVQSLNRVFVSGSEICVDAGDGGRVQGDERIGSRGAKEP
jgi:hypothetical protein